MATLQHIFEQEERMWMRGKQLKGGGKREGRWYGNKSNLTKRNRKIINRFEALNTLCNRFNIGQTRSSDVHSKVGKSEKSSLYTIKDSEPVEQINLFFIQISFQWKQFNISSLSSMRGFIDSCHDKPWQKMGIEHEVLSSYHWKQASL